MSTHRYRLFAIRHQHAGVLADLVFQTAPSEEMMKQKTAHHRDGWVKAVPILLEADAGLPFDQEVEEPSEAPVEIEVTEDTDSVQKVPSIVVSGTAIVG